MVYEKILQQLLIFFINCTHEFYNCRDQAGFVLSNGWK